MAKRKAKTVKWQYQANDDIWQWNHHNKTHRSVSEAFKDADYATAFYRQRSEWEDVKEFVGGFILISPLVAFAFYIFYLVLISKGY